MARNSAKPTLPPELFDWIIEQIHGDISLLLTCSLVCRSWLASSRYHIFRYKVVTLRPRNVQAFVRLITGPSSTIHPYIHTIELVSSDTLRDGHSSQWLDSIIHTLASLPCVAEVLIENMDWGHINSSTKSTLLTGFRAITRLELRATNFESVSHLVQLICSKPSLQILNCDNLGWADPFSEVSPDDIPQTVPLMLHSLRLRDCYQRDILDWLASNDALPPIHHIHFGSIHPEDTHSIGRFLQRLGSSLWTLQLQFWSLDPGGDAEDFCTRVNLAHNSALHTIILDKFIDNSAYSLSSAVGWIPQLMSSALSLKEFSFGVAIRDVAELYSDLGDDPIDWNGLDNLFCHPRFLCLKSLRFWISGGVEFDRAMFAITACLPRSSERKMLQFNDGTPRLLD